MRIPRVFVISAIVFAFLATTVACGRGGGKGGKKRGQADPTAAAAQTPNPTSPDSSGTSSKTDKPPGKPSDKPADKPAGKPGDKPGDKPADKPDTGVSHSSVKTCGDIWVYVAEKPYRTLTVKMKQITSCSVKVTVECDGGTNPPVANAYIPMATQQSCDEGKNVKQVTFECLEGVSGDNCAFDYTLEPYPTPTPNN